MTITAPVRSFLGPGGREKVVAALIEAGAPFNRASDGTAELQQDYLEVVIRKPA